MKATLEWLAQLVIITLLGAVWFHYTWNGAVDPILGALHIPCDDVKFSTAFTLSWATLGLAWVLRVSIPEGE